MTHYKGRIGSVCVNENGDFGLVTSQEIKDMPERSIDRPVPDNPPAEWTAQPRILAAGPMRVAWIGINLSGGGKWRGVNIRAATKEELTALGED